MTEQAEYKITAKELAAAFDEFDRLNLVDLSYATGGIVQIMGKYTHEDPRIYAGCETGIKLGLLIAKRRQVVAEAKR